jgi:hypothetical protein
VLPAVRAGRCARRRARGGGGTARASAATEVRIASLQKKADVVREIFSKGATESAGEGEVEEGPPPPPPPPPPGFLYPRGRGCGKLDRHLPCAVIEQTYTFPISTNLR